ncbi:MAG TPA: primosomal protein N' [Bacillota bacterium]|nr:primosomal protein N' [Bacillota bacterium]
MYAKVVVDVPNVETDKPYDYRIPEDLRLFVEMGSRVSVPFGGRLIQGFVIAISEMTELDKVRDIESVLDLTPPLTDELVHLGSRLSEEYICRQYQVLQAMLPAALRSNYGKELSLTPTGREQILLDNQEQKVMSYLERGSVDFNQLCKQFPEQLPFIRHALKQGWVEAVQKIKNRITRKMISYIRCCLTPEEAEEALRTLVKKAEKQRLVLNYLLSLDHPVALREILSTLKVTYSTVKALEQKKWVEIEEVEERRDPYAGRSFVNAKPIAFTTEQKEVIDEIVVSLQVNQFTSYLLHGVTGSGKTEVYLESIAKCLDQDREAIVLVPEISLTPQMVERFKGRFGNQVAVLHSRLSHGERYDEWRMIREGKVKVVVGARSAVFAPFSQLGLIIIDEEHEGSYKQEESPRYHARDVAIARAKNHHAVTLFGSATPSLESYYQCSKGKMKLLRMQYRVANRPLPPVHVVDMREELREGNRTMFSRPLAEAIRDRLQNKEQMVIFLNRRGFSTFVMCRSCGNSLQCPHCDISLTYHRSNQTVRCHYCGFTEQVAEQCPSCGSTHIRYFGTGTQKVEEELSRHFPGIRVIRMDVDTTTQKGSHEKLLSEFRSGGGDVLLGTQMIAKGLDFPNVTLVGVIAADTILGMPDFRAAERTFQLLTQVGGRAGRHQLPGEVVIQTYNPEHYSIEFAKTHDYTGFFAMEAKHRFEKDYPPFYRLILFTFSSPNVPLIVKLADEWNRKLQILLPSSIYMLGPVASPIPRIKDRYRFQCMLKYRNEKQVLPIVKKMADAFSSRHKKDDILLTVDVDPQILM